MSKVTETRKHELQEIINKSLDKIENEEVCGCYYCCNIYDPKEITDKTKNFLGESVCSPICPHCGIDSVIGEKASGVKLTKELLNEMHKVMF